ncbi:MAG: RNA 2',3'-cyclic phosphodiesterase [Caldilineaceae bacterium]
MRTFIALELPANVQKQIEQLQKQLQTYLRDLIIPACISWTPVAKIHLTLRFLGETNETQREMIASRLTQATFAQTSFPLTLGRIGCFPHFREPNIVWLGIQGDLAVLQNVQAQTEQIAQAASFTPEHRAFSPHLTLGRARRDANRADLRRAGEALKNFQGECEAQQRTSIAFDMFVVDQIVYIQSELRPEGARYTPLTRHSFR